MTSSSSSISVQKSGKTLDNRSKSCDTVCTSNSSCFLQRRKAMNPLMYSIKPSYPKNTGTTSVRQRVLSAKLIKLRSIQSQLNDANFHLSELSKENQILKTLQKRQDKALSKYENMDEDLPRLMHSHEEQLRHLSEKNKTLRKNVKELNDFLKVRDDELLRAQEKLSHLEKLNKDKHLMDREKLMDELEDYKSKLQRSDEQVTILNRKLMLETKTSRQRLNNEMTRNKEAQKALTQALSEIDRLTGILETKENVVHPRKNRFARMNQRQSVSLVTLAEYQPLPKKIPSTDKLTTIYDIDEDVNKTPVTDIKLEPIKCKPEDILRKENDIMKKPSDSIKNRLSSASTKSRDSEDSFSPFTKENSSGSETSLDMRENSAGSSESRNRSNSSYKLEKLPDSPLNKRLTRSDSNPKLEALSKTLDAAILKTADNGTDDFDKKVGEYCSKMVSNVRNCSDSTDSPLNKLLTRSDSNAKLEALSKTLDAAILKTADNGTDDFDKKVGEYCSKIVSNVRNCSDRVDAHKDSLKISLEDTDTLFETFKKTQHMESKLKSSLLNIEEKDMDLINDILSEELKFQMKNDTLDKPIDKNGNINKREPRVNLEDRKKLLATLKAIDNGDSIESIGNTSQHRPMSLMQEIFSDASK